MTVVDGDTSTSLEANVAEGAASKSRPTERVAARGRRGTTFTPMLERVEPDRDRFADEVTEPTLVESEPKRDERSGSSYPRAK